MTQPRSCVCLALALIVLAAPAAAHARIYPLGSNSTAGSVGYTYNGVMPLTTRSLAFRGPLAPPAWFRVTVAWDSRKRAVVVGCRGHGTAYVHVRARRDRRVGSTACENNERWTVVLPGVSWGRRLVDRVMIVAQQR